MSKKIAPVIKATGCCVLFTLLLALASFIKHIFPPQYERYIYGILGLIVAFTVVFVFTRLEKKTLRAIGLQWTKATLPKFFTGFFTGLLLSAIMIAIVVYFNGLKIIVAPGYNVPLFFAWGMSLLLLSLMEEIAFRTYSFITIKNTNGVWAAQVVIAVLFALYHIAGGQAIMSSFLGPGVWAFIFGWAVFRTGGIAMATGIHFAANLFQAAIGQKKQYAAIWQIQPAHEINSALQEQINMTGIAVQVALLLTGIFLTYRTSKQTGSFSK